MESKRALNNFILIKLDPENTSIKLKNGSELYLDLSFEPEKHSTVTGEVWGLPSHLSYCGKPNKDMPWKTQMEVRMHDKVIIYYLSVVNALKKQYQRYILEGNDRYIFVPYESIYAVVRGEDIIPVNGYVLIEPTEDPSITEERERLNKIGLAFIVTERRLSNHVTYGRVKYVGTPNQEYVDADHSDEGVDVAVGDIVVMKKTTDIPLQYSLHQRVNDGKSLLRVQRRNILAKV